MSELIKLILLLLLGFTIIIVGFIIQKKTKKQKSIPNYENTEISQKEQTAKNYIETYKSSYPRESLKQGLIASGISGSEVEEYLNKYLN